MSHQYETAEYKEAIDLDGKYRLRVFEHGKRFKLKVESIEQPIKVTRPERTNNGNGSDDKRATDSV